MTTRSSSSPNLVRALAGFATFLFSQPVLLFLSAGTLAWPAGWAYVILGWAAALGSRIVARMRNPELLRERAGSLDAANAAAGDRQLMLIVGLLGPELMVVVAGLDYRFGWSPEIPAIWQWLGGAFVAGGYLLASWAFIANQFFSAVVRIQAERGHRVVDTGPYALVRHPGYTGGLLGYLAAPLLLGTLWAWVPALALAWVMVLRTANEDRYLQQKLRGYPAYARRVRYRLLPGIW